jgi:hypothetical protein
VRPDRLRIDENKIRTLAAKIKPIAPWGLPLRPHRRGPSVYQKQGGIAGFHRSKTMTIGSEQAVSDRVPGPSHCPTFHKTF